jgi:hypothetical protein
LFYFTLTPKCIELYLITIISDRSLILEYKQILIFFIFWSPFLGRNKIGNDSPKPQNRLGIKHPRQFWSIPTPGGKLFWGLTLQIVFKDYPPPPPLGMFSRPQLGWALELFGRRLSQHLLGLPDDNPWRLGALKRLLEIEIAFLFYIYYRCV